MLDSQGPADISRLNDPIRTRKDSIHHSEWSQDVLRVSVIVSRHASKSAFVILMMARPHKSLEWKSGVHEL